MHSVEHALSVIAERLGLADLRLNENGQVEIVFGERLTAHVTRTGPDAMELSFRLPRLTFTRPSMMREMLVANFLGTMTGPGRLAIDPGKEEVVYCERWDLAGMTADDVERRLKSFIGHGTYWLTDGSDDLIDAGAVDLLGLNRIFGEASDDVGADQPSPFVSESSLPEDMPFMIRL